MQEQFINVTLENIENEHLCCAIVDKKHQVGVDVKKEWLQARIKEGHVFRKLNQKGKVFIEYAPLETAWVPVEAANYLYIYCLWVSGSFKGKGYGTELLQYCIDEAKDKKKSGVCVISSIKKMPFLSDKKFLKKHGFEVVDRIGKEFELLGLSFDGISPRFKESAKKQAIDSKELTVYYGLQCPYIPNCIEQIETYCDANGVNINTVKIDTLEKAKNVPCVFNNWAVFYNGEFKTVHLLNEGYLKKMLEKM
ncbi:GNAT family N-acetyltransferase [Desulfosporosinus fructosivorans]|uniref:GNAT family N-acetyltransferase n=1 Tax=Desulfosporosinus fructosivorans TaxID=2018669 RepID=A0A4Z0RA33_9FIRM|nr:GNAT family N-acetyltransferase [Desulfosporosinus fructosivorans]TGE39149.1 GNAT family N-acetyltransferase [Desulfosporosinus fructosivorans]